MVAILGEENPNETGMFKHFYWTLPLAKYVEIYGLDDFEASMSAIEEITKRGTGEYAVRAFIKKYPQDSLKTMTQWARSSNFHLRRLASEGLRPKLPWASKLELFISDPSPVFAVLEILKEDEVRFVQRSVANNVADYLKVNFAAAKELRRSPSLCAAAPFKFNAGFFETKFSEARFCDMKFNKARSHRAKFYAAEFAAKGEKFCGAKRRGAGT